MSSSDANRIVKVTSPLGDDKLLFHSMTATEELSRPFEITLDVLSEDGDIDLSDLLGQGVTISSEIDQGTRYFNGMAKQAAFAGIEGRHFCYRITLVPWLWFLTRSSDCKIYQDQSVVDIIKAVFAERGFTDYTDSLTGTYNAIPYCVQYRESHFAFVSRLMEREGIYYHFTHADGLHTLVLCDSAGSHLKESGYETVAYVPPDDRHARNDEHIYDWNLSQQVQTGHVTLTDFDYKKPRVDLTGAASDSNPVHSNYEAFDYPGGFTETADSGSYASIRTEEQIAQHKRMGGIGDTRGLNCGVLFELEDHPREDQNREYLIVRSQHQVVSNEHQTRSSLSETSWRCDIEAMDSDQQFRAPRVTPRPMIRGPQTAIVVGPSGDEIHTDEYGHVKVQFHWDRYGESDENSSCWIRVAQLWAGAGWGSQHLPRIGQEVMVEFLEGDPDRPIVTGRVYNEDNKSPFDLPANQTQSGIRSRSSLKGTAETFNELRFEDKADEEHIYFHAQRDFERVVENNDTLKIGFDTKEAGDQTVDIFNNQSIKVGTPDAKTGDQTVEIFNNQSIKVGTSDSADGSRELTIFKNLTETIEEGDHTIEITKGKREASINGDDALTLKQGNHSIAVDAGTSDVEAAKSITLTVGSSSIKIEPTCITLDSVTVKISGSAEAKLDAPTTTCSGSAMLTLKGGLVNIN